MTDPRPKLLWRTGPWPVVAMLALTLLAVDLLLLHWRGSAAAPEPAAGAPAVDAAAPGGGPGRGWEPLTLAAGPAGLVELALSPEGALSTDGAAAVFHPATGAARPLESPVPIPRVFAAGGRLFAQGRDRGAPLLIGLRGGEALVVPVPCPLSTLAGRGEVFVGGCEGGEALAVSRDGASSFSLLPVSMPASGAARGAEVERVIEAVSVAADGRIAIAVAQRWKDVHLQAPLLWTLGHVGVRDGTRFGFTAVPRMARIHGLRFEANELTVAGLAFAPHGPEAGLLRPRLWRGAADGPLATVGVPGPDCGEGLAPSAQGVLLGPGEAAFVCAGRVSVTTDAAESWELVEGLQAATGLWGGDMRLVARAGDKLLGRGFALRSESGAIAVRLPLSPIAVPAAGPVEPSPVADTTGGAPPAARQDPLPGAEIREPALDAREVPLPGAAIREPARDADLVGPVK